MNLTSIAPIAMTDRDAILFELGLTPTWRLRIASRPLSLQSEGAAMNGHGVPGEIAPIRREQGDEALEAVDARMVRIAALEWRDFAADVDACTACSLAKSRRR